MLLFFFFFFFSDKMIIYGNNLDAYSIVQAMLDTGVAPNQIMLAHPNSEPVCPDPLVMKRIEEALESAGVKVIRDVSLKKWLVDEEENLVGVQFLVLNDESEIAEYIFCKALVYMDEKHVDTQAFKGEYNRKKYHIITNHFYFLSSNE